MASKVVKRKHVSMKRKVGWRKNFNLEKDLNDFDEEKGLQERIGKVSSYEIIEDKTPLSTVKAFSSRSLKKLKAQEPARCFQSLENSSKVTDPISARNVKKKVVVESANVRRPFPVFKKKSEKKNLSFNDLWAETDKKIDQVENGHEWFGLELKRHHLEKTNFDAPKITHEKRKKIKPVEKPIAGTSYNPSTGDFANFVDAALEREKSIIKKENKYAESVKQVYKPVSLNELKKRKKEEMTQGLPNHPSSIVEVEEEYEGSAPIPVKNKKKDLRKIRNIRANTAKMARSRLLKIEIQKLRDIEKIKEFKKDVDQTEKNVAEKQKRKEILKQNSKFLPGRLSRKKYEGDEIPLNSLDAPAGSLRKVINSESILVDRYKSLQKRSILPISIKRKPRKGRLTEIEKSTHKKRFITE